MSTTARSIGYAVLFGVLFVVVEMLGGRLGDRYSLYQTVWTRYAFHLAILLVLFGRRDPLSLVRTSRPVFQVARSVLSLATPVAFIMAFERQVSPLVLMAGIGLSPLLILALAVFALGERATPLLWVAAAVSSAGALFVAAGQSVPDATGLGLMAAAAVSFSLYVVMTRSLRHEALPVNLFHTALSVFILLSVVMPWVWVTPSAPDLLIMAGIGIFGMLALAALDRAVHDTPVPVTAPLFNLQLVFLLAPALASGRLGANGSLMLSLAIIGTAVLFTCWSALTRRPLRPTT
ncbi:MAG TPA: DMT family transporter [Xanthobacteraceae bacterium]|nr:DMT family transporter [Xanthobacteraceae bacterium]